LLLNSTIYILQIKAWWSRTRTGTSGDDILLWPDLYLCLSSMMKANRAQNRLTHSLPNIRITSPITFTFPMRNMFFIINSVASAEALQNPFPVMAICTRNIKQFKSLSPIPASISHHTNTHAC
jgi:hypothetical protein